MAPPVISRQTLNNDDGTGGTGTVVNAAFMTALYDEIDALIASVSVGSLVLIGEVEGTDATPSATNVATVAISGLTAKDALHVLLDHSSAAQGTANPRLYNATDALAIVLTLGAGNLAAGERGMDVVDILNEKSGLTAVHAIDFGHSSVAGMISAGNASTFATSWTGSWTLALRTGTGGVTAGGTYSYRMRVFKKLGQ